MEPSKSAFSVQAESVLRGRREVVLANIRTRMHSSDDPEKMVLTSHLEEVGDWADSAVFNQTEIALLGNEIAELRAIDAALVRIEAGTYAVCMECGNPIPEERMMAQPTAMRCIECQAKADKHPGKQHGT